MSSKGRLRRAVGALAVATVVGVAATPAGATATGRMHVEGQTIVAQDGTPFVWHAMQQNNMASGDGSNAADACGHTWNAPPLTDAADIASLGFNTVAVGIAW